MSRYLQARVRAAHEEGDEGAALFAVVIVMVVIFLTLTTVQYGLMSSTRNTTTVKTLAHNIAATDSGTDAALGSIFKADCEQNVTNERIGYSYRIYRSDNDLQVPDEVPDWEVYEGCPLDGDRFLLIEVTTIDEGAAGASVLSVYQWGERGDDNQLDLSGETAELPSLISRHEGRAR